MRRAVLLTFCLATAVQGFDLAPARREALQLRQGDHWNLPSYLGRHFVAHAYLFSRWLGVPNPAHQPTRLRDQLLFDQQGDGSWRPLPDCRDTRGTRDATLINYWALKALGVDPGSASMERARGWILHNGGLEGTGVFTRILLALFGNYPWGKLPGIPSLLFNPHSPVQADRFAQWIGPHLLPIEYLRRYQVVRRSPELSLGELGPMPSQKRVPRGRAARTTVERLLRAQQPEGSWGGYTLATLFGLAVLDDYRQHFGDSPAREASRDRAQVFLRWLAAQDPDHRGVVDDGQYWDSWLLSLALLEAGAGKNEIEPTARYLVTRVCPSGGFSFGVDFCHAPDVDDTSMAILVLTRLGGYEATVRRATAWILGQQNSNGGWGAFSRNNQGNGWLNWAVGSFQDSADLFDESSPDVTGHALEALAAAGGAPAGAIRKGAAYLLKSQAAFGGWEARWGLNYVYGTAAAVVGLRAVGRGSAESRRAIRWLSTKQNADGGFGETSLSYEDSRLAGVGASTPSQTAWGLMALVAAGDRTAAGRAVAYLKTFHYRNGRWFDAFATGTGHPKLLYMTYPSYPILFPLLAIGRFESN